MVLPPGEYNGMKVTDRLCCDSSMTTELKLFSNDVALLTNTVRKHKHGRSKTVPQLSDITNNAQSRHSCD